MITNFFLFCLVVAVVLLISELVKQGRYVALLEDELSDANNEIIRLRSKLGDRGPKS